MLEKEIKKITFVIGSMRRGGAERVVSILANSYAAKNWKVHILTLLDNSNDYHLHSNIEVKHLTVDGKSRILKLPFWLTNIRKHIKQEQPNIVVSFIARINIITLLANLGLNKKILVSERNDPKSDGRGLLVNLGTSILYPLSAKVIFQTEWAKSCFSKSVQKNSVIIPNPISVKSSRVAIESKEIVAVGRLSQQKNHKMLISAFNKINKEFPEYKLSIYGEGELLNVLNKQITDLKLEDSVHLKGNVLNIHETISTAEIFVLSSNYEGLSNALLEAMMMGIPSISTNCAGSNEIIRDGENGLLINIKNEKEMIDGIKKLILNPILKEQIGKNAKESTIKFKDSEVLKEWYQIIEN